MRNNLTALSMIQSPSRLLLMVILCLLTSCMVGGKGNVLFNEVRYPVSGNASFLKEDGSKYKLPATTKPLAKLEAHKYFWGMVYGVVSLTGDYDLGPDINAAIEQAGGNAVANARLVNVQCVSNYFLGLIGILPFVPGCSSVTLEGDIVKTEMK